MKRHQHVWVEPRDYAEPYDHCGCGAMRNRLTGQERAA